ncbi:LysE family translocator [Mangrovibacillus cuniculi]|uniref:LysE family translocator n=1 Tax=Mangrovibacillus cuniculi TaxID=2593652 RepID=A0A7S8C9T2_9BACI|nr:LysE family translocator [Mangrovibacillus cuniculi]QPC46002.1 LysE family translocator [Mangrovibacillus cuniculi]
MELFISFIHFVVLGISLAAPVGPINVEMIRRGLSNGFYSSWLVGLGGMSADIVFLLFILFGIAPFLQHPLVQTCMYVIGFGMLVYLGITTLKTSFSNEPIIQDSPNKSTTSYWSGFGIALFNPINFVFWFGIFGSSIQELMGNGWGHALFACASLLLGIFLWNLNVAFTVHFSRNLVNDRLLKVMNGVAGMALIGSSVPLLIKSHLFW